VGDPIHSALSCLPGAPRRVAADITTALAGVPGIEAIVLGGSYARGVAGPDSDVDLGLYYLAASPPPIEAVRRVAERFAPGARAIVTGLYEWGPWVNGGAWLQTAAGKVDLLYRNLDQVRQAIDEAHAGRLEWHCAQQPPYGFHNVIYLGETLVCLPLHDPRDRLGPLKQAVAAYPPALRDAIVREYLWGAEFTLLNARTFAARGDVYGTTGCLTRALAYLTQVLFAINEVYFINDKGALDAIEAFARRPRDYGDEVRRLLARPGGTAAELGAAVERLAALIAGVIAMAPGYEPKFSVGTDRRTGPVAGT
jgi:hypothetical protein